MKAPAKLKGRPAQGLVELAQDREKTYSAFFVAIRSGLLGERSALAVFHHLENLDTQYRIVMREEKGEDSAPELAEQYRFQFEFVAALSRPKAMEARPEPAGDQVSPGAFRFFFQAIKNSQLSLDQVMQAAFLRTAPDHLLDHSPQLRALKGSVWGLAS